MNFIRIKFQDSQYTTWSDFTLVSGWWFAQAVTLTQCKITPIYTMYSCRHPSIGHVLWTNDCKNWLKKVECTWWAKWFHEKQILPRPTSDFFYSIVQTCIVQGYQTFTTFVVFGKVYDVVPRSHLWYKLSQLGLSGNMLRVMTGLFQNGCHEHFILITEYQ